MIKHAHFMHACNVSTYEELANNRQVTVRGPIHCDRGDMITMSCGPRSLRVTVLSVEGCSDGWFKMTLQKTVGQKPDDLVDMLDLMTLLDAATSTAARISEFKLALRDKLRALAVAAGMPEDSSLTEITERVRQLAAPAVPTEEPFHD
jgi:hypothetical protein